MSEHSDLTKWSVAHSIRENRNGEDAERYYQDMISDADYDAEWGNPKYIIEMAESMLTQKDNLYGVSHEQIINWLKENIGSLIVSKVLFEERK